MTFRDFARNYLNPVYLLVRVCWLFGAFLCVYLVPHIAGLHSWRFAFYVLAVVFAWNGLRPWGKGASINDIHRRLDDLNRR